MARIETENGAHRLAMALIADLKSMPEGVTADRVRQARGLFRSRTARPLHPLLEEELARAGLAGLCGPDEVLMPPPQPQIRRAPAIALALLGGVLLLMLAVALAVVAGLQR